MIILHPWVKNKTKRWQYGCVTLCNWNSPCCLTLQILASLVGLCRNTSMHTHVHECMDKSLSVRTERKCWFWCRWCPTRMGISMFKQWIAEESMQWAAPKPDLEQSSVLCYTGSLFLKEGLGCAAFTAAQIDLVCMNLSCINCALSTPAHQWAETQIRWLWGLSANTEHLFNFF